MPQLIRLAARSGGPEIQARENRACRSPCILREETECSVDHAARAHESKTAVGGTGGVRFGNAMWSVTGSGYYGKGLGTTLAYNGVNSGAGSAVDGLGVGDDGELRTSYGYIGQVTVTPANSKVTIAGSYGSSFLKATDGEAAFKTENSLISGGIYYQATKSLKVVGEGNYMWSKYSEAGGKTKSFTGAFGMMLFY
jgi:hypothetical protein